MVRRIALVLPTLVLTACLLLLPACGKSTKTERMNTANNFQHAMLGLNLFQETMSAMLIHGTDEKGQALKSLDDKALLSWRVAILPYLEEASLYNQFKQDEPWDSEHNKKLIEKMPKIFAPPASKTTKPGYTHMQMICGPNAMQPNSKGTSSFVGGTSNTIALVEAAEAVVWTKPDDVMLKGTETGADIRKKLGGVTPGGFIVAMWDGSFRVVTDKISDKTLLNAINPNIGENLEIDR